MLNQWKLGFKNRYFVTDSFADFMILKSQSSMKNLSNSAKAFYLEKTPFFASEVELG